MRGAEGGWKEVFEIGYPVVVIVFFCFVGGLEWWEYSRRLGGGEGVGVR
jgi:hypothetical protein